MDIDRKVLSADQILIKWKEDRRAFVRNQDSSHFSVETLCTAKVSGVTAIRGVCFGCKIAGRLFEKGMALVQKPMTILVGEHVGMQFVINQHKFAIEHFGKYEVQPDLNAEVLGTLEFYANMSACQPSLVDSLRSTNFYTSVGSYYEHYAFVSSFIEYEMDKNGVPCVPPFLWMWNCDDSFNIIDRVYSLGQGSLDGVIASSEFIESPKSPTAREVPFSPLTGPSLRGIVGQLIVCLHLLSVYGFTHGMPSLQHIGFSRKVASFEYDGVTIVSPLILHLIPSSVSAISIGDSDGQIRRFLHRGLGFVRPMAISSPYYSITTYVDSRHTAKSGEGVCVRRSIIPTLSEYADSKVVCYTIGDKADDFMYSVQHRGIPLFSGSYDLYAFLTGFICEESFHHAVMKDAQILHLWKSLFVGDQYPQLMEAISKLRDRHGRTTSPSHSEILELLRPFALRCDAIDYAWELFKEMS